MFKSIFVAGTLLLSSLPASAEPARMDTLAISQSEAGLSIGCTPAKLCVEIVPSQADGTDLSLYVYDDRRLLVHTPYRLTALSSVDDSSSLQLWPKLIRFDGGILAGVETQVSSMYSGGGASSTTLHLIAFLPGQPPLEVLSVPQRAHAMIRACFSERDMKQRAGACHDEYSFEGNLTLTGAFSAGMPLLRYRSKATSFPGQVSRSKDSLKGRPLRKHDIVTVSNQQCSYQRLYHLAPETRGYVPDTPPPDCSDYTEP